MNIQDAEKLARKINEEIVDIRELISAYGVQTQISPLSADISVTNTRNLIYVNQYHSANRQRFSFAHGFYHYIQKEEKRCTIADLAGLRPEEENANQFAAALIMPATLMEKTKHLTPTQQATIFITSEQAILLRRRNLHLDN